MPRIRRCARPPCLAVSGVPRLFRCSRVQRPALDAHRTTEGAYVRSAPVLLWLVMNRSLLVCLCYVVACGGASSNTATKEPEPAASSSASVAANAGAPAAAATEDPPADVNAIPQKCADGQSEGICAPARSFVKTLCGTYPMPDIALIMFSKSSPFTKVYMNRNMEAWYTS